VANRNKRQTCHRPTDVRIESTSRRVLVVVARSPISVARPPVHGSGARSGRRSPSDDWDRPPQLFPAGGASPRI